MMVLNEKKYELLLALAKDNQAFKGIFENDLNPDINLDTLTVSSGLHILYTDPYGEVMSCAVNKICSREGTAFPMQFECCKDVPRITEYKEFMKNYPYYPNKNINIEIQPYNSGKLVFYPDENGALVRSPIDYLRRKIYKEPSSREKRILGDQEFWKFCVDYNRSDEIRFVPKRSKAPVLFCCPDCKTLYYDTPYNFFVLHRRCPLCTTKKITKPRTTGKKVMLACIVDPSLADFWNDERPLDDKTIFDKNKYGLQCPRCHHRFFSRLSSLVNASPKCPLCKDTGLIRRLSNAEIDF